MNRNLRTRLHRFAVVGAALTTLGLATTAARADAAGGCAVDCVGSITTERTINSFNVKFTTSVPTSVLFKIWKAGSNPFFSLQHQQFTSSHTFDTSQWPLEQGQAYGYSLKATDQQGNSYTESGGVIIPTRTVKVTITSVKVTDDSDSSGSGEIRAGVRVTNSAEKSYDVVKSLFSFSDIASGGKKDVNKTFTWKGVASPTKLQVELYDDDADAWDSCSVGFMWYSFDNGANACGDWTTASINAGLRSTPGTSSTAFSMNGSGAVDFTVTGTITVTVA